MFGWTLFQEHGITEVSYKITSDNCFHFYAKRTQFLSFRIDRNQKNLFMAKDYSLYIIHCN